MEINKTEVEKLIEINKKDNFFNHLWNVASRDFSAKGEIKSNEIRVWRQNFWNMTFYPVFIFQFNSKQHLINISSKINPIGKLFNLLILLSFISSFFLVSLDNFEILKDWKIIALFTLIMLLGIYFAYKVYSFERRNQLDQIFEILDIEVAKTKEEKESSILKIITRILLYPFCIGLILFALFYLIPIGEIFLALGSLAVGGTYLYSDLRILLERKTTGNNG